MYNQLAGSTQGLTQYAHNYIPLWHDILSTDTKPFLPAFALEGSGYETIQKVCSFG